MKSLVPWFCLVAAASTTNLYAADGLDAYRQGKYMLAGKMLTTQNANDPVVNYYLGRMRLYGFGELKNNALALRYFTQSAEKGYLPAQKLLAHYYLSVNEPAQAMTWFKKAAAANDTRAQMFCAAAYLHGFGVNKNEDSAQHYYIEAAKKGEPIAQYALGKRFLESRDGRNKKLGLIWLTKSAEKGNPKAQLQLADMYINGTLVAKDPIKGKTLMESAAAQNFYPAMFALGTLAQKEGQLTQADNWFNKAATSGNVDAQLALGRLLLQADYPSHDQQKGIEWLQKAAKNGSVEAQKVLTALANPESAPAPASTPKDKNAKPAVQAENKVIVDPAKATAQWLSNDRSEKFSEIGYTVGGIFNSWQNPQALQQNTYNQGPQLDALTRKELYKPKFTMTQPTEIGISEYFDVLAPMLTGNQADDWTFPRYPIDRQFSALLRHESKVLRHEQGISIIDDGTHYLSPQLDNPGDLLAQYTPDWQHSVNMQAVLSQLYGQAILGESDAQFEIGQLYQYGIAVKRNIPQAITYYELAAGQGDVRAEYNLGVLYLDGKTDPLNYQKGIDWMTDAAFKGNPYAQYVLANIYEKGLEDDQNLVVVKPNHEQALAMYYLASVNHFGDAEYRLADFLVREKKTGLSVAAKQNRIKLIKRLYQGAANEGVVEATLPLAFYNAMDSEPAKQAEAFAVAKQAATAGNPEAALLVAIMYERGISVPENQVEALYWYQQASMNPVTGFILGTYYSEGKGLGKDIQKGKDLLQQAADGGFSYAGLNLAILQQQNGEAFLPELNKAKNEGNSKAGILLADYYLLQANDPQKMNEAREIYQYLANKGDRDAQLKLAFLYDRGLGGEANIERAEQLYTESAEQGQPLAQFLLGHLYQMGRIGKEPDYNAAKKWYEMAKKQYNPAAVALGFIYDTVEDDYLHAAVNYQIAADKNNAIGALNLGLIYEYGKGMPVDNVKAMHYYQAAADKGVSKAMSQMAGIYFRNNDKKQAVYWYEKAATLGDENAQYHLGLLSEAGVGVNLDFKQALKFYQASADQGNQKAQLALARMYQYGSGVTKDLQHAADIYRELADKHNAFAQYQLAIMYANNALGEPQPDQAKKLLEKAKANGYSQATALLNRLNTQNQDKLSFVEPLNTKHPQAVKLQSADLMYFDALSEWNRGDETMSRVILDSLVKQYPQYAPAKRAYEQLNQHTTINILGLN